MDQLLLQTIGNRNFGNYWFYLGPANIVVYGRENINTLAAIMIQADLPLRLQVGALLIRKSLFVTLVSGAAPVDQSVVMSLCKGSAVFLLLLSHWDFRSTRQMFSLAA
jgi:hypothetical protein